MDEYIKRELAIEALSRGEGCGNVCRRAIERILADDVAPVRHGRWLPQVVLGQKAWDCSECKTLGSPHWKWCPVCGAKMDGDE